MLLQIIIAAIGALLLVVVTAIAAFLAGRHFGKAEALRAAADRGLLGAGAPPGLHTSSAPAMPPPVAAPPSQPAFPAPPVPPSIPAPPPSSVAPPSSPSVRVSPSSPSMATAPPPLPGQSQGIATPQPQRPRPSVKWAPPPPSESSEPKDIDLSHADPFLNWLFAEGGVVDGKSYHIGRRTVTVGRGEGNFIQVAVPEFSRIHCRLTPCEDGLQVKDVGSSNGVFYKGKKTESFLLRGGDSFKIGDVKFVYHQIANFDTDHVAEKKKIGPWVRMATVLSQQPVPRPVYLDDDGEQSSPEWPKGPKLIDEMGEIGMEEEQEEPTWVGAGGSDDDAPESTTNVEAGGGLKAKGVDELRGYLWDESWRLQAAIQLMRRGEASAVADVFRAAEAMPAHEQSAFLQGMPPRSDELENALLGFLDIGTPNAVYLAACTLSGMASQRAIPRLFDLIEDPTRVPTPRFFAQAFIPYGDAIVDGLTERLKGAGQLRKEHPLLLVLEALSAAFGPHIWQQVQTSVPSIAELAPRR